MTTESVCNARECQVNKMPPSPFKNDDPINNSPQKKKNTKKKKKPK